MTETPHSSFRQAAAAVRRRFALPAAAATAVLNVIALPWTLPLLVSLHRSADGPGEVALFLLLFTVGSVAAGLLLIGIPAGLAVARLRLGIAASAALLAVAGLFGGIACAVLLSLIERHLVEPVLVAIFAAAGAVTAALWTFINADLFRRHNGA